MTTPGLAGRRVLVVEDEPLIAMLLEDMLLDMGASVAGVADTVAAALEQVAAADGSLDAAVLDMNLRGRPVDPVADLLAERGVPFVFASGYGADAASGRHSAVPVLAKPFRREALEVALRSLLDAPQGSI